MGKPRHKTARHKLLRHRAGMAELVKNMTNKPRWFSGSGGSNGRFK